MKHGKRFILLSILFLCFITMPAQRGFKKDSLQFKIYTKIYVNQDLRLDSIALEKVFCDFCNEAQTRMITLDALRQTEMMVNNPEYQKHGIHKIVLFVRYRKDEFRKVQ